MPDIAHDRRSPRGGSVREFVVPPARRAFDLVSMRSSLESAAEKRATADASAYEARALEALSAIARAMAPTLDEIRAIAARHDIGGEDFLRDPRLPELLMDRFAVEVPDAATCRRYYDAHPDECSTPPSFAGREILIGGDIGDRIWRGEAYGRAERVIAMLVYNRRVFPDLVIYSAASSRAQGGRIGPVARGAWKSDAADAFFSLKEGEIFPLPVPSAQGFHILLMDRVEPGRLSPFAEVYPMITNRLVRGARIAAAARHLRAMAGSSRR